MTRRVDRADGRREDADEFQTNFGKPLDKFKSVNYNLESLTQVRCRRRNKRNTETTEDR